MIPVSIVVWLVFVHLIMDFFLQSDWMALNKSKSWKALLAHTSVYACGFLSFGTYFALITFVLHTLTDAVASRITSKLWFVDLYPRELPLDTYGAYPFVARVAQGKRHWFFVVIGIDQFIHIATLVLTYVLLHHLP